MNSDGVSVSDAIALRSGNGYGSNGMFGGDWGWIILLILLGWGGNGFGFGGFGGFGGGAGLQGIATRADINEGFALQNITGGIQAIQQGICDSTYALNNTITNGFHGVDRGLCDLGYRLQECCCENRAAIADVKYAIAQESCATRNTIQNTTRDILENNNNNTRAILDFLTQDKISTLTAENQALKFQASQTAQNAFITANQDAQTAELIRRLGADCPVPAYVVQPSTPVTFPVNGCGNFTGFNNGGCGCGFGY